MIRRLLPLLAFVAFAHAPAGAQRPPTPCTAATPECTEWIAVGAGGGRSLVYRNFPLDTRNEAITRAVIVVHGAGRDADNYYRSALAGAFLAGALQTALVISPRMASNAAPGCGDTLGQNEISWNCDTWRSGGPSGSHPAENCSTSSTRSCGSWHAETCSRT